MSELFDIPESKSPRLIWMEKHQIVTHFSEVMHDWMAITQDKAANPNKLYGLGPTELDAITDLARKLNIKLWNEQ